MKKYLTPQNLISLGGVIVSIVLPQILFREEYEEIEVVEEVDPETNEVKSSQPVKESK